MEKTTKIWLDDADYDIQSAATMLRAGRYFYVIFMCHLAMEKMLKAAWAERRKDVPPKVHGLVYLADKVFDRKDIPDDIMVLISDLDDKHVITSYPDGRQTIAKMLTREYTGSILKQTRSAYSWLKKKLT